LNRYFCTLVAGVVSLAAVIVFVCASTVLAASLGDLVSGPAGSNGGGTSSAGTSGNTGPSSTGSPNFPPLQTLNLAESGPVSAASGACPNVSCNDSGQCVAISFDDVLGIGATNPSSSGRVPGSTSSSGSGGKSSRAKGTPATSTIHGPGGLVGVSVCFTADQALGSSNSTGGICFPVSGSGSLNGQTLTDFMHRNGWKRLVAHHPGGLRNRERYGPRGGKC
jgi:hypothetical protein